MQQPLIVRNLGITDFNDTYLAMQRFTTERKINTPDELWLTEHPPIFTIGLNQKDVRLPNRNDIPLVQTDRGGKITYHGPGQVVIYVLMDLKRYRFSIRNLVTMLENTIIELLADFGINATAKSEAPGVYIQEEKIASIGLRIKNNCCYHGLSLNVNMDLQPFEEIDPCGYVDLKVTQIINFGIDAKVQTIGELLLEKLSQNLANGNLL